MTEQLLHRTQIGTSVEQMRGERVAQRVNAETGILIYLLYGARRSVAGREEVQT